MAGKSALPQETQICQLKSSALDSRISTKNKQNESIVQQTENVEFLKQIHNKLKLYEEKKIDVKGKIMQN